VKLEEVYLFDDLSESLFREDFATALIVSNVVRRRVQTRHINFSRINCDAERIIAVWLCTSRDNTSRETSAASAVDRKWDASQALQKRRFAGRLATDNNELRNTQFSSSKGLERIDSIEQYAVMLTIKWVFWHNGSRLIARRRTLGSI
jgi:hypothetical protein